MKSTKTLLSLAAVAAVLTLAACGDNGASAGGSGDDDGGDAEEVNLTFATFSPDQEPAIRQILDVFEEENPGVTVDIQIIPWTDYWSTLQTSTAGGTGPDVAWMLGAKIGQYIDGGVLLPLDDAFEASGLDIEKYPEPLVDLFVDDGTTYALPKDFDTIGLWYNKALFDEAGLAYPTPDWTWDDVVTNAQALTKPDGSVYGIGAPMDPQATYYNTIYQAGGEVISEDGTTSGYDSPEAIEGIKFWTDMINVHHVSPTLESFADTESVAQFMSGRLAMLTTGSFYAIRFAGDEYASENLDVTELPGGAQEATIINGIGNVALASTEHPEVAAELAVFLSGEEASQISSETGTVIGSYDGTQQAFVDAFPQFNLQAFLDQAENGVVLPVSRNTDAWASREGEFLTPAWTGEQPVEEAAAGLAGAMNEALAQENQG